MPIVVGDIHGNLEKTRAFLDHKPDELHIALGDYVDSFYEPVPRQVLALQTLLDSKAVLLWGNHDLHYLKTPPFVCTGYQYKQEQVYRDLIEPNKHRFLAAYAIDGWLLTHAGVHDRLVKDEKDVSALAANFNKIMAEYIDRPYEPGPEGVFSIGKGRGGEVRTGGGIFWFDFLRESGLADIKQIFGHTETREGPVVTENYVALDTTNNKSNCWFYDTAINEIVRIQLPRRIALISDLPEDEQEPFREWLIGQTVPEIGGYFEGDYMRWKQIYG